MPDKRILVNADLCDRCGTCIAVCPHNAVEMTGGPPVINASLCQLCAACVQTCSMGALCVHDIQANAAG